MVAVRQKEKYLTVLFFILGFISLIRTVFLLWNNYLPDFSVLYDSSKVLLLNNNPYLNKLLYTQVNYPPTALLFFYPFLIVSFSVASKIWTLISVFSLLGSLFLLYKIKPVSLTFISIVFLASTISFPFKFTLGMGQVNLVLLFLLCLSLFLLLKKKNNLFTILFSIAAVLKLFPLFLIVTLFFKREYKRFILTIIFILFLLFIPSLIKASSINNYYFTSILFPLLSSPAGDVYYNQSITGFFARLNLPFYLLIVSRFILIIYSLFIAFRKRNNLFFVFSLLLSVLILTNNFSWQHHLILLLIPFYFLISNLKSFRLILILLVSFILVSINIKNPYLFSSLWYGKIFLSHGFLGILILWFLLVFYKKYEK